MLVQVKENHISSAYNFSFNFGIYANKKNNIKRDSLFNKDTLKKKILKQYSIIILYF